MPTFFADNAYHALAFSATAKPTFNFEEEVVVIHNGWTPKNITYSEHTKMLSTNYCITPLSVRYTENVFAQADVAGIAEPDLRVGMPVSFLRKALIYDQKDLGPSLRHATTISDI